MRRSAASAVLLLVLAHTGACAAGAPAATHTGLDGGDAAGAGTEGGELGDSGAPTEDAAEDTGGMDDGGADGGSGCFVSSVGVYGQCITISACAALGNHTSTAGYCPGATDIECCTVTPNVADNPPVPNGWKLMPQSAVTADMTAWAVSILHDPTTYPMFATATRTFGSLIVLARVEWHPPDFQNSAVHRGVTLYEPA